MSFAARPQSNQQTRSQRTGSAGFSLIELAVVIIVLGVLAAIAVPRVSRASAKSRTAAARMTVREFNMYIEAYYMDRGSWPTLGMDDVTGRVLHPNPFSPASTGKLEHPLGLGPTVFNPSEKLTTIDTMLAGWWYNIESGSFRGRVPHMGTSARTITLYNSINGTRISTLAQTAH